MKSWISALLVVTAVSSGAEPLRIRNERAIAEREELNAIRAAARESAAELVRQGKIHGEKLKQVAPLFEEIGGRSVASGDVVRVGGAVAVAARDIAAEERPEDYAGALKVEAAPVKSNHVASPTEGRPADNRGTKNTSTKSEE